MPEQGWFEIRRFPHAVTMIGEPHHFEDVKSYLIEGERDVAVLDTGLGVGNFAGVVAALSSRRPRVLQNARRLGPHRRQPSLQGRSGPSRRGHGIARRARARAVSRVVCLRFGGCRPFAG